MVAAFVGIGSSSIDRHSDLGILNYALTAAANALADAGVDRSEVDGYVGIASSPNPGAPHRDGADQVSAYLMTDRLGLGTLDWVSDVSGFAVNMAIAAAQAIGSGQSKCVLGLRAVYNLTQKAPPHFDDKAWGVEQYKLPFGAGPGGTRFATRMRQYMERSGARREDIWSIVRASREHARNNPIAYFRDSTVTLDDYMSARMIVDPLCLYDCDMPVCGAAAFVMTTAERAKDSPHRPAYLRGYANWTTADSIFERSGIGRADVQVCQLYDGYSFMLYEWLERLRWCEPDAAWKFVADGHTCPGGSLPVNTFGGSIGEGRLHGMGHLREGILQVMHRAGDRQVEGVENCLVQVGPFDLSSLAVIGTEPE